MKKLYSIEDFGNIDAKLDELLEDCFAEHNSFNELRNFKKFLVIGKKGSGKTAIFRKILKETNYNTFVEGYNLTDYPWYHHNLQAKTGAPDSEKFIQSWKYLLLLAVSKLLLNLDHNVPFDNASSESIIILEQFIVDTYGSSKTLDIANIFTPNKKIKFTSLFKVGWGSKKAEFQLPFESVDMTDLPKVIREVNENLLSHVMKCIHPDHNYYICFDELDIGFDKKSSDYFNSIIGLIRAARDFNIKAKSMNKKINICLFLRDDIYDLLKFEDKRKITQNFASRIEWDTKRTDDTLKNLMEKRFTKLLQEEEDEIISWEDIFDETVSINGRMTKYNYIVDTTCLRPRDMIDFCNNVLREFKNRGGESSENIENHFINDDIINAKYIYSSNLLEEFDDEIHKHLPEYEIYLDIIKKVGKSKFTADQFIVEYEKIKNKLEEIKDPLTILEDLFAFSIIGNHRIGGQGGGSGKLFRYKNSKEPFREDLKIIVHPGLVNVLRLKEK